MLFLNNKRNTQNDTTSNKSKEVAPKQKDLIQFAKDAIWVFIICVVLFFITGEIVLFKSCNSEHSHLPLTSHITTESRDSLTKVITTYSTKSSNDKQVNRDTINAKSSSLLKKSESSSDELLDSIVYNLTLAVNSVNNVLTGGTIALGIITLFFGFIGFFGFHSLKDDIKEYKQETSNRLNNINNIYEELKQSKEKEKALTKYISSLNQFLDKINIVIYSSANAITNQMDFAEKQLCAIQTNEDRQEKGELNQNRELLNNLSHQIKIMQLYRICLSEDIASDEAFAVFAHFKAKGDLDDCSHLEYIKENCPDINHVKQAQETIWYIKNRLRKNKESI